MGALLLMILSQALASSPCEVTLEESRQFLISKGVLTEQQELSSLQSLDLSEVQFAEEDLRYLCHASELASLKLYSDFKEPTERLLGPGLRHLESLKKLQSLDLDGNLLTAESLKNLKSTSVQTVKLYDNPLAQGENGLSGLDHLLQLTSLKSLVLQGSKNYQFNSEQLAQVKELPNHPTLTRLLLMGNDLGQDLSPLSRFQKITTLDLSGVKITPQTSLVPLASLTGLKSLSLGNESTLESNHNQIGPGQIAQLKKMKLETLELSGLNLSDIAVEEFRDIEVSNLLMANASVTPETLIEIAKNSPGVLCIHVTSFFVDYYTEFLKTAQEQGVGNRFAVQSLGSSGRCRQ